MKSARQLIIYGVVACLVIITLTVFYAEDWTNFIDDGSKHEVWGAFGDFFGGVYGTIFAFVSVILMVITFYFQKKQMENSDTIQQDIANKAELAQEALADKANEFQKQLTQMSIDQAELQRFNELFFALLNLYKSFVADLGEPDNTETQGCGCFYLDQKMTEMMAEFNPSPIYGQSAIMANYRYTRFYLENASMLAPVFRTLYRIMELIDTSPIQDKDRLLYAKIVRAQLRESELFFLRYNCMTQYGDNFTEYVNKYRLLKHLPIMSLLEFKSYRNLLGNNESVFLTLNLISRTIWRTLRNVTIGKIPRDRSIEIGNRSQRYSLTADMHSPNKTVLTLTINIHKRYTKPDLKPLSRLDYNDLAKLLENLLSEIYRYSNYRRYNRPDNQIMLDSWVQAAPGLRTIVATISSDYPLRLTHPAWDRRYGLIN